MTTLDILFIKDGLFPLAYHYFHRYDSLSKFSFKMDSKLLEVFYCWEHDVTIVQPVFTEYLKSPIMVNFRIKFTMPITPNLSGYWKIG